MRVLARQFVMGRTIGEALARADPRLRYSFDMLGEAAKTQADAERYRRAYLDAIGAIGRSAGARGPIEGPGISVKLSALHPRYEPLQAARCVPALIGTLTGLARAAKDANIGITVDAEEADRLEISLDIFAAVLADPVFAGWDGLGLAVQAYQKRAIAADRLGGGAGADARGTRSRYGWSRALTGTARSSSRRCRGTRIIRCSPARRQPM